MKKTIYLANPYGFSKQQNALLLPPFVAALESLELEVWEPFARNNQGENPPSAHAIGKKDCEDVANADGFFAIVNGMPADEGVMIELGMAAALGKPVFLFRDDFRTATDSGEYPLNLMLFTTFPEKGWREYYYEKIEDITDSKRPLAIWARS